MRVDTGASPAEFLFGTTLRLPGEFFLPEDISPDPNFFIQEFREYMRQVRPVPVAHKHAKRAFYFKELHNYSHVFMRNVAKKALERPYSDPHKILQRVSDRIFNIDVNGSARSVSVEFLKPAHFVPDNLEDDLSVPVSGDSSATSRPLGLTTYSRRRVTFAPGPAVRT
ncbi:PREDICTED: uncharacterized protein LOC107190012 [Dufourea novaeangliae]|uniref:uncharacterized protein LOC107190012 n=1 Tax=Dufourea novaeangliae TaxID=178035 RepID=UPI000767DD4D|nr:PREDICTED: uncharacterized protein LOC107190012 [Dufourea novaeangliae]